METFKIIFLLLNAAVQVGLVILLAVAVRRNRENVEEAGKTNLMNQKILELSQRQREILSDQIVLSQKVIEEHFRPTLVAFLERQSERNGNDLVFILRNVGKGVAKEIIFRTSEDLTTTLGSPWVTLFEILPEIDSLNPGHQLLFPLERAGTFVRSNDEYFEYSLRIELIVNYCDQIAGTEYEESFELNLAAPTGLCRQ